MKKRDEKGRFVKGSRHSPATEFKYGHIPFNKGKSQIQWMSIEGIERTRPTRFQPGQIPRTANPEGTVTRYRHTRHGKFVGYDWYINIDPSGKRHAHYNYRKYLWEKFHGEKAPKDMIFIAKNGNQAEKPTIGNIEMITKAENLRRNNPRIVI